MKTISASPLLLLLRSKKLLPDRLRLLGLHDSQTAQWLVELDSQGTLPAAPVPSPAVLETLQQHAIIRCGAEAPAGSAVFDRHRKSSLAFVRAVNFELTYDCNWNCSHCLQQGIRQQRSGLWLSTDAGKRALQDAWFAGLVSTGINFTGGEPFLPQSNLLEFVEAARSLDIGVRINTNGWWGKQERVRIGNLEFRSPGHVVGWLREIGVGALALSLDRRYHDRPEAWLPVVAIVKECERHRLPYQFVCTGVEWYGMDEAFRRLIWEAGISPSNLVPMDMIDIGGAAGEPGEQLYSESVAAAVHRTPCKGKGFFRPSLLHIAPGGGVRTCLYAPGGGWLGNINRESLLHILSRFAESPVTAAFCRDDLASLTEATIKPYAHIYRSVAHPCAASAVLAKVVEKCDCAATSSDAALRRIHASIAEDMNLRANQLKCNDLDK
jgi:MoaA/NifB/PqqE/SkfB family radical SAM enzyme